MAQDEDEDEDEVLEVSTPEQFRALAHPLRQRMLFVLGQRPATTSQLAVLLDAHKGSVAHHLRVLSEGGLVRLVETRRVRGGTERYYGRVARRLRVVGNPAGPTAAMLAAVAEEIGSTDDEPLLVLRHVRLTRGQVERLATMLGALVDAEPDSGEDGQRHGVLVGVYRYAEREPAGG